MYCYQKKELLRQKWHTKKHIKIITIAIVVVKDKVHCENNANIISGVIQTITSPWTPALIPLKT